jgi:hypothetical protein
VKDDDEQRLLAVITADAPDEVRLTDVLSADTSVADQAGKSVDSDSDRSTDLETPSCAASLRSFLPKPLVRDSRRRDRLLLAAASRALPRRGTAARVF